MREILEYTEEKGISLLDYVLESEPQDIVDYALTMVEAMFAAVERGLVTEGVLPGKLRLKRRAPGFYKIYLENKNPNSLVFAAALAVSEENASGNEIVTAPTCGSSGVLPAVLYTFHKHYQMGIKRLARALLVGGLIGNLVKHNASISGAEVGCQGEIGTACAMAAAASAYLKGGSNRQIEYAAEIALEHHLGMTCDPVMGYVQIPASRNALSERALDSCEFALHTGGEHFIDLDACILTLKETGKDLSPLSGNFARGLAKAVNKKHRHSDDALFHFRFLHLSLMMFSILSARGSGTNSLMSFPNITSSLIPEEERKRLFVEGKRTKVSMLLSIE